MVSPGEGWLVPEAVRGLARHMGTSAANAVQSINAAFSNRVSTPGGSTTADGTPAFWGGGIWDRVKHGAGAVVGGVRHIGSAVGHGVGAVAGGVRRIGSAIGSGIGRIAGDIGHGAAAAGGWIKDKASGIITGAKNGVATIAGDAKSLFLGGLQDIASKALAPIKSTLAHFGRFSGGLGDFPGLFGHGGMSMIDKFLALLGQKDGGGSANVKYNVGAGVSQWKGLVESTLAELGQPKTLAPWVLRLIAQESSGNPNAQNNTDINAQNGIPSQGLMQTTPPTFASYAGKYRSLGIRNPHANIYAGLNYGIHEYGAIANIPGIRSMMNGGAYQPYDTGGIWPHGTTGINLSGKPEVVFTNPQWSILRKIADQAMTKANVTDDHAQHIGTLIQEGAVQFHVEGGVAGLAQTSERTMNDGLRKVAATGLFGG
jgi:SLT domain-containing protein